MRFLVAATVIIACLLSATPALASPPDFPVLAVDQEFNGPTCYGQACAAALPGWDAKTNQGFQGGWPFAGWAYVIQQNGGLKLSAVYQGDGQWRDTALEGLGIGHAIPPYLAEVRAAVQPADWGAWAGAGWTQSWPYGTRCGVEVDFAELLGRAPDQVPQTVHSCTSSTTVWVPLPPGDGINSWHTYAAAVYFDHVDFYIDGIRTASIANAQVSGTVDRSDAADLWLSMDVGQCGTWAGCPTGPTTNRTLYVDWLRVYLPA